jgi:hypothetical protein
VALTSGPTTWVARVHGNYVSDYANQPNFVKYLREKQYPNRKLIVKCWTSLTSHYGNSASSRLEGGHATIKAFLHGPDGDLLDVVDQLHLHINREYRVLGAALSLVHQRKLISIQPNVVSVFDDELLCQIVPLGLKLAYKQYNIARSREYNPRCSGRWTRICEVPCCHTMKSIIDNPECDRGVLNPSLFGKRWHSSRIKELFQLDEAPRINPLKGKGTDRPQGSKNKTSSGKPRPKPTSSRSRPHGTDPRNPLLFERN